MVHLPPDPTPLYNHPLPALEEWLRQLGAHQHKPKGACWNLQCSHWSADIELETEELKVIWHHNGHESVRHFPYGLTRADVSAAILAGP